MDLFSQQETVIVLDFETTGMYPDQGDRVIEIGAVTIQDGQIRDHFQSLINPGFMISREIESITGITNAMLKQAPDAVEVMEKFTKFIQTYPLVAHNAAFDRPFLDMELWHLDKKRPLNFACTLQIAKRLYPDIINYKLATLVRYKEISITSTLHRALTDAELTARLWLKMQEDLVSDFGFKTTPFELMKKIGAMNRKKALELLQQEARKMAADSSAVSGNLFD